MNRDLKQPTLDGWVRGVDGDFVPEYAAATDLRVITPLIDHAFRDPWGVRRTEGWIVIRKQLTSKALVLCEFSTSEAAVAYVAMAQAQSLVPGVGA